jgi:hypothetical protein
MSTVDVEIIIRPQGRGKTRRSTRTNEEAANPGIPRIARLMALAVKFQDMVERGEVHDYADLARLGYVTRARLTQIMNLQLLAPDIQEMLLFLPPPEEQGDKISETVLRPLCAEVDWDSQRRAWSRITRVPTGK